MHISFIRVTTKRTACIYIWFEPFQKHFSFHFVFPPASAVTNGDVGPKRVYTCVYSRGVKLSSWTAGGPEPWPSCSMWRLLEENPKALLYRPDDDGCLARLCCLIDPDLNMWWSYIPQSLFDVHALHPVLPPNIYSKSITVSWSQIDPEDCL